MEFFGFSFFGSLTGGGLLAVAAVIFVVGLILVIKGGDWFVDSASWFAEATGIPKFVVGATVVSFATTLPELLVSLRAAMNGSAQLAIGNAVGSVTANTTLIMGLSVVAIAGVVNRKEFALKGGLLLAAIVCLTVLSLSGALPVWSAFILWAIFITFMVSNLLEGKKNAATEKTGSYDKKEVPSKVLFFVLGTAAMIDGILDRFCEELGEPATIVATGGLSYFISPVCKREIIYDRHLILKGLKAIYEKNK